MPFVGIGVGIGRQRFVGGGGGFDADYQAVLDYANTQGYTLPSSGQQVLQNQLVVDLKSCGIWSKLDTFGVFATDGDSDFALIDWKRLVLMTAVNSPTFTTNQGFTGNGTSSWINSNYNPSVSGNLIQGDNANTTIYMNTVNDSGFKVFYGCLDSNSHALYLAEDNTPGNMRPTILSNVSSPPAISKIGAKWFSLNRENLTQNVLIQDNSSTTSNNIFSALPNMSVGILARNQGGTPVVPTTRQASLFSAGESLISQNTDYRNAWLNYFTSL